MSLSQDEIKRYARHLVLKDIGGPGQQKLKAARVLIVGTGGLGAPAALYLAAAGIGALTLVDDDVVSLSNLQRQVLFGTDETGQPKTAMAARALKRLNPHVHVETRTGRFSTAQAGMAKGQDVVLDATDNFASRFAINAACHAAGVPLVSGAAIGFDGQLAAFDSHAGQTACYRCLVPGDAQEGETCESMGVIGALTGVIGAMMALEAIKVITGAGTPLLGRLLLYDGLAGTCRTLDLPRDPACPVCGDQSPDFRDRSP